MLIVLNHKMNLNIEEITRYEEAIRDYPVVVMPQTPYMGIFSKGKYILGSQCISEYNATGGVSADALVGMNVKYVMVGHLERRIILNETDEVIVKKIKETVNNGMIPILCIGETLEEKESGNSYEVLESQINNVFDNTDLSDKQIVMAYEPAWSIGTDITPSNDAIYDTINFIKKYINAKYNINVEVLYGGSVNANNVHIIKLLNNIDGIIVGSASLNIDEVLKIIESVNK